MEDPVHRAFREGGPEMRERVVREMASRIQAHFGIDARALYRFLLGDPSLVPTAQARDLASTLESARTYVGTDRETLVSTMARVLEIEVRRYVLDPRSGLLRDRETGEHLTPAAATFEQLVALRERVRSAVGAGHLPDAIDTVPDTLPADLFSALDVKEAD